MEEVEIKELFEHFKNNIFKFTLIALCVCFVGCLYSYMYKKPVYTSSTTIVLAGINNGDSQTSTINTTSLAINSQLVTTYREIAKSRKVLEQVIDELSLEQSYESLAGSINVSSVNETEIIRVSVNNQNPEMARKIANSLAGVFSKETQSIYNMNNISILDKANLPQAPSNINITKQCILYFGLGLVFAFAFLFLTFYFDTTIKSIEQVEKKIALPILGSVPNYSNKRRKKA